MTTQTTADDEPCDLREELSMYDDSFPRDDPTWGEDSQVTPRAFLCEYGYDVDGSRLPETLATHLIESDETKHQATLFRVWEDSVEEFTVTRDEKFERAIENDSYCTLKVYRLDVEDHNAKEVTVPGPSGYIVSYSYIRAEDKRREAGHDRMGYYWMELPEVQDLVQKLLGEMPPKKGLVTADDGPFWYKKRNPAENETWAVFEKKDSCGINLS